MMNTHHTNTESSFLKQDIPFASTSQAKYSRAIQYVDTMTPKDISKTIFRYKWLIVGIVFFCLLLTIILLSITPPRYTADALLIITSHDGSVVAPASGPGSAISNESIENEIEVIQSRALSVKVIKLLKLDRNPDFNAFYKSNSLKHEPLRTNRYLPGLEKFSSGEYPSTYDLNEAKEAEDLLKAYYDGLSVTRKGNSQIIHVEYTAKDPLIAKNIVNAISDQYIQQQLEMKYKQVGKASELLFERIQPLQKKVEESETAVENFRNESGLLESKGVTLTGQQLTELNNQLIQAEKKYDEAKAKFNQIDRMIKTPQGAGTISAVRESTIIRQLRMKEVELQQKLSDYSTIYRPLHPTMIKLQAEMKDISNSLNQEMLNIKNSLNNDAILADKQKHAAKLRLNELKEKVAQSNKASVQLRALEREAEANRKIFETFLSRFKSALSQKDIEVQQPNAQILSRAITPVDPSFPKKIPLLALVFVGSSILSMLFVIVRESMDRGFINKELIEKYTGVPSLGYIPTIKKNNSRGKYPEYQVILPESLFAESIRLLYTSIILSSYGKPVKSILLTSAQYNEGTTTITNSLAISRALAGRKTIIIDTDFKKAKIKNASKIKPSPGLAGLLNGDIGLMKVIRKDSKTGTHMIHAGSLIQNSADILLGKNMDSLIRVLYERYDLIVFDTPPILEAPNASILTSKVDATVLVSKWNFTKRHLITKALSSIAGQGNNIVGVVLNMVDEKKMASNDYLGHSDGVDQLPRSQKLIRPNNKYLPRNSHSKTKK